MTDALELGFPPGEALAFIEQLWRHLPIPPDGVLVGAMHLVGDQGQIVVSVRHPQVQQVVVRPEQILVVPDPVDPSTWTVVDDPNQRHLRLPT